MKTREWFYMDSWRHMCGLPSLPDTSYRFGQLPYEELEKIQWVPEFEEQCKKLVNELDPTFIGYCKRAMIQDAYRYGTLSENKYNDPYPILDAMLYRMHYFLYSKDLTLLVDIGNFAMIMFYNLQDDKDHECRPALFPVLHFNGLHSFMRILERFVEQFISTKNLIMLACIFSYVMAVYRITSGMSGFAHKIVETEKVKW